MTVTTTIGATGFPSVEKMDQEKNNVTRPAPPAPLEEPVREEWGIIWRNAMV